MHIIPHSTPVPSNVYAAQIISGSGGRLIVQLSDSRLPGQRPFTFGYGSTKHRRRRPEPARTTGGSTNTKDGKRKAAHTIMQYLQYVEKFVDGMKVVEILQRKEAQGDGAAEPALSGAEGDGIPRDAPGQPNGLVFFCMHGFGANAYDLAGLSQHLKFPAGTRYLFPDGILRIDLGYGAGHEGRAWFPIDFAEIERIRREGGLRDLSKNLPAGMAEARDKLIYAMQKLECDPAKTVVGGFSQGAMLATEIMLSHSDYLAGLVIFSGTLVNRTGWETNAAAKFGSQQKILNFIQSHGRHDPVLPFQAAERLHEILIRNGGKGEFIGFDGQHEIPTEVIDSTNKWLANLPLSK